VVKVVAEINRGLGIPAKLSEAGVRGEQIAPMVEQAWDDACHLLNPRLVGKDDLKRLYETAI
jgi:alcohol dehydrogenase class IV